MTSDVLEWNFRSHPGFYGKLLRACQVSLWLLGGMTRGLSARGAALRRVWGRSGRPAGVSLSPRGNCASMPSTARRARENGYGNRPRFHNWSQKRAVGDLKN